MSLYARVLALGMFRLAGSIPASSSINLTTKLKIMLYAYTTPQQAAKAIGLPEDSHLIAHITWAAFYYAYNKGHYKWRDDSSIDRVRSLFISATKASSIYDAFYKVKDAIQKNTSFMANALILNEDYFIESIKEVRAASWVLMSSGTMSSLYDLKAFIENGFESWSWEISAGTDNMGVKPPRIKFS